MSRAKHATVLALAQQLLRDDRHWSQVEVGDRAEDGIELARAVLEMLGVDESPCPPGCRQCAAHAEEVGE